MVLPRCPLRLGYTRRGTHDPRSLTKPAQGSLGSTAATPLRVSPACVPGGGSISGAKGAVLIGSHSERARVPGRGPSSGPGSSSRRPGVKIEAPSGLGIRPGYRRQSRRPSARGTTQSPGWWGLLGLFGGGLPRPPQRDSRALASAGHSYRLRPYPTDTTHARCGLRDYAPGEVVDANLGSRRITPA